MSTHFTFTTDIIRHVRDAPPGALGVLMDLLCRAAMPGSNRVSAWELAHDTHVAETDVHAAIRWLTDLSYLTRSGEEGEVLTFPSAHLNGPAQQIRLDYVDEYTETTARFDELTDQLAALTHQLARYERNEESGLAKELPDSADEIREIEGILGRALTWKEVYFLGQMADKFGLPKVIGILRSKWKAKDPLRTTYAVLNAMDAKQQKKRPPVSAVDHWTPDEGYDPWTQ